MRLGSIISKISIVTLAGFAASSVAAAPPAAGSENPFDEVPISLAGETTLLQHTLAEQLFGLLPSGEQDRLRAVNSPGSATTVTDGLGVRSLAALNGDRFGEFDQVLSRIEWEGLTDEQRQFVLHLQDNIGNAESPVAICLAPDTDPALAAAINAVIASQGDNSRFQQSSRWNSTAYSGGGLSQGDPTIISYSFVPDGTFVPDAGLGSGNSQLFNWMNGIYGSTATWQGLFTQIFDRWAALGGTTYVLESDDGASLYGSSGQQGVRGDVRISAIGLDGNSGVLAYNFYPQTGDMVLDAFDSFYNSTGSNSRRLRNVVAHEHGHGMGMAHVCPAVGTKLMEPFISTAYDGPQLDDTLNLQRHYGDLYEPSNSAGQAITVGSFSPGSALGFNDISIDDNTDVDYFRIDATEPMLLTFSAAPAAGIYLQGAQNSNGSCSSGVSTNYNIIHDLVLGVYDSSGTNLIASSNVNGAGATETLEAVLPSSGTYYARVSGGSSNSIQLYDAFFIGSDIPFLGPLVQIPSPPADVAPGVPVSFEVTIDPREDSIIPNTPTISYSYDGGSFIDVPLTSNGGNSYSATLPGPACGDSPEYYISVIGATEGVTLLPSSGTFSFGVGTPVVAFEDDFESNLGWTVSGNAADGQWNRGVPVNANRGDPSADGDGSGRCYLTDNSAANGGNSDVDGGSTILTSPAFDVDGQAAATVSYYRWYSNDFGANPMANTFRVEISGDNGSSWTTLETVGPGGSQVSGGWFYRSFTVSDFVTPTNEVRVRFTASDIGSGAVVEAAVDGLLVEALDCEDPADCPADLTGDGVLDFFDVSEFLVLFGAGDLSVDFSGDGILDFFDVSQYLAMYGAGCP